MFQQDTLYTSQPTDTAALEAAAPHKDGYHSPREILSWLPSSATPAQQDSAIRAHTKFEEVDWSQRHNPMCTPQTHADTLEEFDLSRPMYHGRTMLNPDSIYRPEVLYRRPGMEGNPVPYTIGSDNLISSIVIGCFVIAMVSVSKSASFIRRMLKNFFRTPQEGTTVIAETSTELRIQIFLLLQTALLAALVIFFFNTNEKGEDYALPQYAVIGIFMGITVAYFALKFLLYMVVNWVFFDHKKNEQWMKAQLFILAGLGIVVFPIVLLMAYFNLSIHSVVIYGCVVVILFKLLSFYKAYLIFFRKTNAIVQSFLYLCALEMMPLGALWGALALTDNYLKVNL